MRKSDAYTYTNTHTHIQNYSKRLLDRMAKINITVTSNRNEIIFNIDILHRLLTALAVRSISNADIESHSKKKKIIEMLSFVAYDFVCVIANVCTHVPVSHT